MKQPTSKQPNPPKFKPNNRCLIPFHTASVIVRNKDVRHGANQE